MDAFSPFFIRTERDWPHGRLSGLDLLASAVLILDTDGRIGYVNPAAEDLLEYL